MHSIKMFMQNLIATKKRSFMKIIKTAISKCGCFEWMYSSILVNAIMLEALQGGSQCLHEPVQLVSAVYRCD